MVSIRCRAYVAVSSLSVAPRWIQDTVVNSSAANVATGITTGIVSELTTGSSLLTAIPRALALDRYNGLWNQIKSHGIRRDVSWALSAREYLRLHAQTLRDRGHQLHTGA